MTTRARLVEVVGWTGAALVVGAYGLLSAGWFEPATAVYHALNLVGGVGLMVNAATHRAWPPVFVNSVWVAIAVAALAWGR